VSVILQEMCGERGHALPLTISCQKKRPGHCHDDLIVNHFDDESRAFRHDRP
jgi:hypothetical protein